MREEHHVSIAARSTSVTHSRRTLRSLAAVSGGFVSVAVLSLATDQALHVFKVYPPWGEPMREPGLNFLALSYRLLYTVAGGYITSRLSPYAPMRHVTVLGALGFVAASAGAIAAINLADLGPSWYPIALVVTAFPCVWLGGVLDRARRRGR
jgi:hypothetical protein